MTEIFKYVITDKNERTSQRDADVVDVSHTGVLMGYVFPPEGGTQEMVWAIGPDEWSSVERVN
jgi:hypothetical protein